MSHLGPFAVSLPTERLRASAVNAPPIYRALTIGDRMRVSVDLIEAIRERGLGSVICEVADIRSEADGTKTLELRRVDIRESS